jgi:hypothetical protein
MVCPLTEGWTSRNVLPAGGGLSDTSRTGWPCWLTWICCEGDSGTCKSSDQVSRSKSKKVCLGCAGNSYLPVSPSSPWHMLKKYQDLSLCLPRNSGQTMKGGQAETSYRQAEGSLIQVVPAGLAGSLGPIIPVAYAQKVPGPQPVSPSQQIQVSQQGQPVRLCQHSQGIPSWTWIWRPGRWTCTFR